MKRAASRIPHTVIPATALLLLLVSPLLTAPAAAEPKPALDLYSRPIITDLTLDYEAKSTKPVGIVHGGNMWVTASGNTQGIGPAGTSTRMVFAKYYRGCAVYETCVGNVTTATPGSTDTFGAGNQNPRLVSFKERLYIIWESSDSGQKPAGSGNASDILMRTYVGTAGNGTWSGEVTFVSPAASDTYDDREPFPIVFKNILYVFWQRISATDQGGYGHSEVAFRTFDGSSWSPAVTLPGATGEELYNTEPYAAIHGGLLYLAWQSKDGRNGLWDIHLRSFDGASWGAVENVVPSYNYTRGPARDFEFRPRLASTGDTLYVVWQSIDPTYKNGTDTDIVARGKGPSGWGPVMEVTPPGDTYNDVDEMPDAASYNGYLYVSWSTNNPGLADGEDFDIVLRGYDGRTWGAVVQMSREGDATSSPGGDDFTPSFVVFAGRLYLLWTTNDPPVPRSGARDILVRLVFDADADGDGVPDYVDAFPDNPKEWKDSDGDGVGDNSDPRVLDPAIWDIKQIENIEVTEQWPIPPESVYLLGGTSIVLVGILVFVLMAGRKTRGMEKAGGEEE